MDFTYKSTDQLEVGDYIYWPDFMHVPAFGPYAVCKVIWSKGVHLNVEVNGDGVSRRIMRPSTDVFVRYIGKRPPWAGSGN